VSDIHLSHIINYGIFAVLIIKSLYMIDHEYELCDDASNNENMPWDIHLCPEGDIKLVHRTQPILGRSEYNFDNNKGRPMSASGKRKTSKSGFGLPREKVRNFMTLIKPRPMHWRQKIRPELYP